MKLVTYAVAAYNHERFVRESLESAWNDGYQHKEFIIIDDGSSDNTVDVIEDWCREKDWRSIKFQTGPNVGITATLNKLISIASGEYIRLVSSDDLLLPGGTEKLARILDDDQGAIAAFGDAILIDEEGSTTSESTLKSNGGNKSRLADRNRLTQEIITNWAVSGPVILIRRNFFLEFGCYDESLLVDDWDLYSRIAAMDGLRFIDATVAKYRIHGNNVSRTTDKARRIKNLASQSEVAMKNMALFDQPRYRDLLLSERYLLLAKIAYLSDHWLRCAALIARHFAVKARSALRR